MVSVKIGVKKNWMLLLENRSLLCNFSHINIEKTKIQKLYVETKK